MKKLLFTLPILTQIACKVEEKKEENLKPETPIRSISNANLATSDQLGRFKIEDEACQEKEGLQQFNQFEAYIWNGEESVANVFPAQQISSSKILNSSAIKLTAYGYIDETPCSVKNNSLDCQLEKTKVIATYKSLRICENKSFKRDSIEGVAITSILQLDQAWSFYQSLSNKSETLKPANLMVLPRHNQVFTSVKKQEKNIITYTKADNLAFDPGYIGIDRSPSFIIYPTSDNMIPKDLNQPHLWESSWGLSHEFGHYILFKHAKIDQLGRLSQDLKQLFMKPITHDHHHLIDSQNHLLSETATQTTRKVSIIDYWGAINEGFSDLFAFYTLGGQKNTAQGLPCLQQNRDILNSKFTNGVTKNISPETWKVFIADNFVKTEHCLNPSFQSIHTIGAIIAYGFNQLYQADPKLTTAATKSNLILTWADRLGLLLQQNHKINGDKITLTLEDLIFEGLKAVNNSEDQVKLNQNQCVILKNHFAAFAEQWIHNQKVKCY